MLDEEKIYADEEFREVPGYEKYYVSNYGRVYSTLVKKYLTYQNKPRVSLRTSTTRVTYNISSLVALTFLNLDVSRRYSITHKDGNKENFYVGNLEIRYLEEGEPQSSKSDAARRSVCYTEEELDTEEWRTIEEFPSYKVSNLGRVAGRGFRILKPTLGGRGYFQITFRKNEETKCIPVHRLVAKVFLGPVEDNLYVNHIDGNKLNNRVSNLEWITPKGNMEHAVSIGLKQGFTEDIKKQMAVDYESMSQKEILDKYKCSSDTLYKAVLEFNPEGFKVHKLNRREVIFLRDKYIYEDYSSGMKVKDIIVKYNISQAVAYAAIRKFKN